MACGIHLFANTFPNPFGDQLRPHAQHANVSAPKRESVLCNVPACLKQSCLPRNCKVQRKDVDLLLALQLARDKGNHVFNRGSSIISQSDSHFASQSNCSSIAATLRKNLLTPSQVAPKERRCNQVPMQSLSQVIA